MSLPCNSERGEAPLVVGGVDLVIAAEIGRLAALSTRLGSQSFMDMYSRLANAEINALIAGVELLTVRGDVAKAVSNMTLADMPNCVEAFMKVFSHHAEKATGNVPAAKEKTKKDSLGGNT